MFRFYVSGESVPKEVMHVQPLSSHSIIPEVVIFSRCVLVYTIGNSYHIRPLIGMLRVNSIYIDQAGDCKIIGGGRGLRVHTLPIVGLHSVLMIFLAYLLTNIFS